MPTFAERPMNRRHFLGTCAAGTVAGAAVSSLRLSGAATSGWTIRLSTSSVQFSSLSVEEACRQIAALGFEGVDFWPSAFKCPHLDEIEQKLGGQGLRELLARHKLKLCGFSVYQHKYSQYAKLLGEAGGGLVIRASRYRPSGDHAQDMKSFMEQLKPELELAERYDSYLAVENHKNAILDSFDSFKAFLDVATHPRLGIALAPFHLQWANVPVEKVIELVGDKLLFFYAWQKADGLEQLPGIGPTDFTPWLAALAKIDYRGWVNPFMHHQPDVPTMAASLAKARQYLLNCAR